MEIKIYLVFVMSMWQSILAESCDNQHPCAVFKGGEEMILPQQVRSKNGKLNVILTMDVHRVTFDWFTTTRRLFNKSLTPPTIRVKPGDTLKVTLINNLEYSPGDKSIVNATNIYFQGLHVEPESNDALNVLKAGKSRTFTLKIPCTHPSGTFTYQPTFQGSLLQVSGGATGLLIIEDNPSKTPDELNDVSCPFNCPNDLQIVFQPALMYSRVVGASAIPLLQKLVGDKYRHSEEIENKLTGATLEEWLLHPDNKVSYFTTNGRLRPIMQIVAGQVKRFRLVNGGATYTLEIEPPTSVAGRRCEVKEIAVDGLYLDKPREVSGQTLLLPGGRVDWVVRCDVVDTYSLESKTLGRNVPTLTSSYRFQGQLLNINVVQPTRKINKIFPSSLPARSSLIQDLQHVNQSQITGRFVVEVSRSDLMNRESFARNLKHKMALDSIQEWTLLNPSSTRMVPLHIPLNYFQVISYNNYKGPSMVHFSTGQKYFVDKYGKLCEYQYYSNKKQKLRVISPVALPRVAFADHQKTPAYNLGFVSKGEWRSTLPLPPLSNITIRFIPKSYTGIIPIFSHNFLQKDQGMIILTKVVAPGSNLKLKSLEQSKDFLPGTCHPGDWYPSNEYVRATRTTEPPVIATTPKLKNITSTTLLSFFNWLYKYYPNYKTKYGDQTYLAQLYQAFLQQYPSQFHDGSHLTTFFDWIYRQFPMYQTFYGRQTYLTELYNYYITQDFDEDTTA